MALQGKFKDKKAVRINTIVSIIALIGIILGLGLKNPLIVIIGMLPAVIYEIIRTAGVSTKFASVVILLVLIMELILIFFNINIDLAKYLGSQSKYIAGYSIPLGDIKIVAPALTAILAIILFIRTAGVFTKWLSIVIFVSCFVMIYLLSPEKFPQLFKWGIQQATQYLNRIF